jgi:hypothetical protein
MKNTIKLALALCVAAGAAQSAFAAAQDLTTWSASGFGPSFVGSTDATIVSGNGSSTSTASFGGTVGTILSKNFSFASSGATVSFDWYFVAGDYMPYNDFADVKIGGNVFGLSSVGQVGDYGNSGWQSFSHTVGTALNGPVSFIVSNYGDNGVSSSLEIRNVQVSAVPESTNLALMLAGLGLLGVVARRRSV